MRKSVLKSYQNFPYFATYWATKGASPLFEQICIPISQARFLPSLVEIGLVVLENIFKQFPIYLRYKRLCPWVGAICDPRDFICTNLNLLVLGMFHAKYCPIWCNSSLEDDFLSISLYITM